MTTKEELATWTKAVDLFNNKKEKGAKEAIKLFSYIDKYSKVLFNIGMIYLAINDCENADVLFGKALLTDKYFGAAYFQKGVALFYLYEYDLALRCYEFCLDLLLGNDFIDYTTLGLSFKLYRCEILYNLAICNLELGNGRKADSLLREAHSCRRTYEHKSIISHMLPGNAIPFSISSALLFCVPEEKLKNMKKKDFMKSAKLVVDTKPRQDDYMDNEGKNGSSAKDGFIGFTGAAIINAGETTPGSTLLRRKTETNDKRRELVRKSESLPGWNQNDSFRPTHRRNASEPAITPLRSPNTPRKLTTPQSPSPPLSAGARRLPDFLQQRQLQDTIKKQPTKKSKLYARKSSLPTSRYPLTDATPFEPSQTLSPALSDKSLNSSFGDDSADGLRNLKLADDDYEVSETLSRSVTSSSRRSDVKIIIHNKKANTSFRAKRGITIDEFFQEVMDALNLASTPENLCFVDDGGTMIDLVDQEDLDAAMIDQKSVHFYLKDQFQKSANLIDLYAD